VTQQLPQIPSTEPELAGIRNFRDVGGLPTVDGRRVRYGRLFRSGHLAHATAEDAAFLGGLGLHTMPPTSGSTAWMWSCRACGM
jgi:protein-tyrosine phosphatase